MHFGTTMMIVTTSWNATMMHVNCMMKIQMGGRSDDMWSTTI